MNDSGSLNTREKSILRSGTVLLCSFYFPQTISLISLPTTLVLMRRLSLQFLLLFATVLSIHNVEITFKFPPQTHHTTIVPNQGQFIPYIGMEYLTRYGGLFGHHSDHI